MNSRSYPAEISALILVDVLNDFLAEEGKLNGMIRPMLDELALIPKLEHLVVDTRASGLTIVYAPHGLHEHSFDDIKHLHPRMQTALENRVL
jgi:ureidoacrylate peracid hydrolase